MPDPQVAPFEDEPPLTRATPAAPVAPASAATPVRPVAPIPAAPVVPAAPAASAPAPSTPDTPASASVGAGGTAHLAPGSPEEAAIILEAMSQRPAASRRSGPKAGFVVGIIAVIAAAIVALVISAAYLRHQAADGAPAQSTAPAGGASVTPAAIHLRAALAATRTFESAHGGSLEGVTAALSRADPSITFSVLSDVASEISVASPVPGTLVLSSLQTGPPACLGILQVLSPQAAPVFAAYPVTSERGVYYFEAPVSAGECDALTASPPSGGYLSAGDFPSESLP